MGFRMLTYSAKLGRVVHLFSFLELCVFLFAESNPRFVDIKENWPLTRDRTRAIAKAIKGKKVRHPCYKGVDIVMTTDLYIKEEVSPGKYRYLAWSTKSFDELRRWRPVEKLQIEELYHTNDREQPATFSIMTREKVPANVITNLRLVRGTLRPGAMLAYTSDQIAEVDVFMRPHLSTVPLNILSRDFTTRTAWTQGQSVMSITRYLIATRRWPVDMSVEMRVGRPLTLLSNT